MCTYLWVNSAIIGSGSGRADKRKHWSTMSSSINASTDDKNPLVSDEQHIFYMSVLVLPIFFYGQYFNIPFAHRVDQRARPVFGRIYWTKGIIVEMASIIIEMSKRSQLYKIEIHHRNSRVGLHSLRKCHVDHIPYHITSHHPTTWHTTPDHTTPHHIASHPTSHHIIDINPLVSGGQL